jgi:hypothetical protein
MISMKKSLRNSLALTASGILVCLSGTAGAEVLADARGDYQTTVAGGTTAGFNGGEGLSDTEGSGRWNYLNGNGNLLTFGGAGNAGQSMYATVGQTNSLPALGDQQIFGNVAGPDADEIQWHAGTGSLSAVMRWTAGVPIYGLEITGDIARSLAHTGDVRFDILVNGVNEFSVAVSNTTLAPFNLTGLSIGAGQHVEFILSRGSGNSNDADIADLQATISGSTTPPAVSITSFTATPATLGDAGDAVTFDWAVTGTPLDSLVITPGDIDVLGATDGAGVGSYLLDPGPNGTTEYTLTATKGGDTATGMVTVTLPAPEITSFTASPSAVGAGENVTLSWQVGLPATTLTITPGNIDVSGDTDGGGAGSIIVNPNETTTYTLTATRGTSTSTADATAAVVDPNNLFSEDFNSYAGTQNATQYETGLKIAFGGAVTGWTKSGAGTMHAVDLANLGGQSNPSDWAIMFYQDNVITSPAILGANEPGAGYEMTFDYGTGVYAGADAGQIAQRTLTGDGLLVQILRADNSVLASQSFFPGAWDDAGNHNLDGGLQGTLTYTGDGSGNIRLRIGPDGPLNSGRFEGTIDNISVAVAGGGATFADWQTANSTAGGVDDDHDGDGVNNGVEFFLGGPSDTSGFTTLPDVTDAGGTLSVTWAKHGDYPGTYGTDYRVEVSTTLLPGSWSPADPGDISGDVTYTFPAPLGPRVFARLVVTGPQ